MHNWCRCTRSAERSGDRQENYLKGEKSQQIVNNKAGVTSNYLYRTAYSPCHSDKLFLSNSEAAFGRAPSKEGSSHLLGTKVQQWTLTAPSGFRGCGTLEWQEESRHQKNKKQNKIWECGQESSSPVKEDIEVMGLAWGTPRSFLQHHLSQQHREKCRFSGPDGFTQKLCKERATELLAWRSLPINPLLWEMLKPNPFPSHDFFFPCQKSWLFWEVSRSYTHLAEQHVSAEQNCTFLQANLKIIWETKKNKSHYL